MIIKRMNLILSFTSPSGMIYQTGLWLPAEDYEIKDAIPTIASDLKLSVSTVCRGIRDLKKAELLETEQRYRKKGGKSSLLFRLKTE